GRAAGARGALALAARRFRLAARRLRGTRRDQVRDRKPFARGGRPPARRRARLRPRRRRSRNRGNRTRRPRNEHSMMPTFQNPEALWLLLLVPLLAWEAWRREAKRHAGLRFPGTDGLG